MTGSAYADLCAVALEAPGNLFEEGPHVLVRKASARVRGRRAARVGQVAGRRSVEREDAARSRIAIWSRGKAEITTDEWRSWQSIARFQLDRAGKSLLNGVDAGDPQATVAAGRPTQVDPARGESAWHTQPRPASQLEHLGGLLVADKRDALGMDALDHGSAAFSEYLLLCIFKHTVDVVLMHCQAGL